MFTEHLHMGGGSVFAVDRDGRRLSLSTNTEPESVTVVSLRSRDGTLENFTLTRDQAVALMTHLSEVTK